MNTGREERIYETFANLITSPLEKIFRMLASGILKPSPAYLLAGIAIIRCRPDLDSIGRINAVGICICM
jgi:hypothetical protein